MKTRHSHVDGAADSARPAQRKRGRQPSVDTTESSQRAPAAVAMMTTTTTTTTTKRKKHVKRPSASDDEQLSHELQEAADRDEPMEAIDENAENIPLHRSKRVRFSNAGLTEEGLAVDPTAGILTPSASQSGTQRTSLSPSVTPHPAKVQSVVRTSLPSTVESVETRSSPNGLVAELQFSPLRTVLDGRVKRRLRRSHLSEEINELEGHKRDDARTRQENEELRHEIEERDARVRELLAELESLRQGGIEALGENDEDHKRFNDMEAEVVRLKAEIIEREDRSRLAAVSNHVDYAMSDDEQVPLINPADLNISPADMTPRRSQTYVITAEERVQPNGSGTPVPDPTYEAEILNFERTVTALTREAADARAALRIIAVELQSLGFSDLDESAEAVLTSIRTAFHHARVELEELLPGETPDKLENRAFLNLLIEKIRGLVISVREKTTLVVRYEQMEAVLRSQSNGLLDKLAEVDSRKQQLETRWQELDAAGERKEKRIVELEEEVDSWQDEVVARDELITRKDQRIAVLESESADHTRSIHKLNTAIAGYRDEVRRLEELISRMERNHQQAINQLEQANVIAVEEMGQKFQTETERRETAEADLDAATTQITELELRVEADERELEKLREALKTALAYGDLEKSQREQAEAELDAKTADTQLLEEKVTALENSLDELRHELEALRDLAESERRQRQAAETELDERNAHITGLDALLHDAGVRANELRQKLFEAQLQKEKAIADMREAAAEREEQYQNDMAAEIARREAAERTAAGRNVIIAELEEKLRATEAVLLTLTVEKDTLIAHQESRIAALETSLEALRRESRAALEEREIQITALHSDIATLTRTLSDRAALIAQLQDEAIENGRASQAMLENQEGTIADLNADLDITRSRIADLEAAKRSLERRVQDEAEHMLALQSATADETGRLNGVVRTRDESIAELLKEAEQRDRTHADALAAKERELEALQIVVDARAVDIAGLSSRLAEVKARYRREAQSGQAAVAHMATEMRTALERAEGLGKQYADASQRGLEEVERIEEAVKVDGGVAKAVEGKRITRVHERVRVIKKGAKSKRKFDSGFGVASDEAEEEGEAVAA